MWIKRWIIFIGNQGNVESASILAHFAKNAVRLCQLTYAQKNPHALGKEYVEELVDNVDNSTSQGGFPRFYIRLRPP